MRVSRAQAEQNRREVVSAAGRLFRERGFDGVGLSELMGAVGLTQGGFYKQFKSKNDLVVESCSRALTDSTETWRRMVNDDDVPDAFAALVGQYLSKFHRDSTGSSCLFASLGPDAARHSSDLRSSFEVTLKAYGEILGEAMNASLPHAGHEDPLVVFSTMVGALLLSRVVNDEQLSNRILESSAKSLLDRSLADEPLD